VEALFAYDVVGFHTEDWLDSFRDYVTKELGGTLGLRPVADIYMRSRAKRAS
jgi:trehalose-6-phosphate synthase